MKHCAHVFSQQNNSGVCFHNKTIQEQIGCVEYIMSNLLNSYNLTFAIQGGDFVVNTKT